MEFSLSGWGGLVLGTGRLVLETRELVLETGKVDSMSSSSGVSDSVEVDSEDPMPTDPEHADGIPDGELPLALIPTPIPLAAFPVGDLPLDVVSNDDIDLFEGPPEDDHEGGAPIADNVVIPIVEAPVEEAPADSPGPDSFESVASASLHHQGVQHYSPDADSDVAMSAVPGSPHEFEFEFDHEFEDEFDPVFPPDFDPDHEIEFIPVDQPLEAPVAPIDQLFYIPADFDKDFADPEPFIAPEPVVAHDPVPVHNPIPDDAPVVAPPVLMDAPAIAPPIVDIPIVAPPVVDVPITDAPLPDPVPAFVDRAPFAAHIDPRYADTHNGWIEDDDDYPPFVLPVTPPVAPVSAPIDVPFYHPHISDVHRTDLPITFLQDIPPPRPGEGSSRQQPTFVPPVSSSVPFMSWFPHTTPSFVPSGEPFLWSSPNVMPLSDPYHPFHVGYTTDDIFISLQLQQDALSRRVQELERTPCPPCHCQTPFAAPHAPLPLPPDSDIRFLTSEQQIAYLLHVIHALEEDWVRLRRLIFFPPPPLPPSA
ncbi:proline-rich extensin-like protein EPR1 [Helianthus annuus]|uniref:proline-rich extensin-like protein EPR1 n=1 Tax=Helianthus annuus TaxID=4232 RepID=UPI000B8FAE4F|nr:proline-rich extensin-like protein EPR1 [Helianthus annuus]